LRIKGIDEDLYRALGVRARREGHSIDQQVLKIIRDSLAGTSDSPAEATIAFLGLCGSWQDPRTARTIAASLRRKRWSKDASIAVDIPSGAC
jgi:plasmid stability protein